MVITCFQGKNRFLSNFWPSVVYVGERKCYDVETAYQLSKTDIEHERDHIQNSPTPWAAKARGQAVTLRQDWESIKYNIMYDLVLQKFKRHPDLATQLLATEDAELVEGNVRRDTYWGVCAGVGQNKLGIILMGVREILRGTGTKKLELP